MIFFRYFFLLIVFSLILSCSKNNIIPKVEDGIFKKSKDTNSIGITIFPGDTLLTLSKKYKVSIKELIKSATTYKYNGTYYIYGVLWDLQTN